MYGQETFLHPPIALYLFAPFTILPLALWWAIPLTAIGYCIVSWRPAMWSWPILALALAWPRFHGALLAGNPIFGSALRSHWGSASVGLHSWSSSNPA